MVKVSVIVPVYNAGLFLQACIESLIHQTLQDIEIIFVDDVSTDDSLAVIQGYQQKDQRIVLIQNAKNLGAAFSRNQGISIANGKYIQFVDADDYLELNSLEALYVLAENNCLEMCYLGMQFHIEDVEEDKIQQSILGNYLDVYNGKNLLKQFTENNEFFLYLCSVFYKRSFINEYGLRFKELTVGEGGDFILRALCCAERVMVEQGRYYHYRVHGNSITHNPDAKKELLIGQIIQYIDVLQFFAQYEDDAGMAVFLKKQYRRIYGGIQSMSVMEQKEADSRLDTGFSKHVFHMIQQGGNLYGITFDDGMLRRIRNKAYVVVYGAGHASKEVLGLLQKYAIEIIGFMVTKRQNGKSNLYGHHIYEIQELVQYNSTAVVLVAANKIYNQEIQTNLEQYGFCEVIFLNVEI